MGKQTESCHYSHFDGFRALEKLGFDTMIGRLFRVLLLFSLLALMVQCLLGRQQKRHLHRWLSHIAAALLVTAALAVLWSVWRSASS